MKLPDDEQRSLWNRQLNAMPLFPTSKKYLFAQTVEFVEQIGSEKLDILAVPMSTYIKSEQSWRDVLKILRPLGLADNTKEYIFLTREGKNFLENKSKEFLGLLISKRVKLFAEILSLLKDSSLSIKDIHEKLTLNYPVDSWKTLSNVRSRITWLEVLGFVEWVSIHSVRATELGKKQVETWTIINPLVIEYVNEYNEMTIECPKTPYEILRKLNYLSEDPLRHKERNTYNIWAPSPTSRPNKIDNMHICISRTVDPVSKDDLLEFIATEFGLRRSSVESMMPFMRSAGLIQEVRKGVYTATPLAREWIESNQRVNFIRILHAHMRFIGEILKLAESSITRTELYDFGSKFGLNKEKIRWRINFLIDANLLIELSYSSLKASQMGKLVGSELPLSSISEITMVENSQPESNETDGFQLEDEYEVVAKKIIEFSTNPLAEGKNSGVAFEEIIAKAFSLMGFDSKRISGSGDTDVLVRWNNAENQQVTAIIDAKSSAQKQISHTSVSDVAIGNHREKNLAERVAIVAPGFAGDTLRATASAKKWSLVTAQELADILKASKDLGLRPSDISVIFDTPDGVSKANEIIENEQRKLDLIELVVSRIKEESENDEPVSARDISLIERQSDMAPTADELVETISIINSLQLDILKRAEDMKNPKYDAYQIGTVSSAINRLRALASALEDAIEKI
ncbi:restriction endonuclease [Rothia amarae]|uniref:restriction endonuclease n=1 Tax=Rothia amarae TaxID=169480 RepID=UPI0033FDCA0A